MIPRVQETDTQRKLRLAEERIEELTQKLSDQSGSGVNDNAVPQPIVFAAGFVHSMQRRMLPVIVGDRRDTFSIDLPPLTEAEIGAFDAALGCLADYFDRQNVKFRSALDNANHLLRQKKGRKRP